MSGLVRRLKHGTTVGVVVFAACRLDDPAHEQPLTQDAAGQPQAEASVIQPVSDYAVPAGPVASGVSWLEAGPQITAQIDSSDRVLRRVRALTRAERRELLKDVSAVQIVPAHRFGIPSGATVEQLVAQGKLVELPQATELWVLRDMNYSVPYLVPSAEAMLREIATRFHARLDSLGVARFRLEVTSALRTPDTQAELRRHNSNAARTESAHEFGTTIDIAYRKFAPPLDDGRGAAAPALDPDARLMSDSLWMLTARMRGVELQAVLGRVMKEMRSEGKLVTRMERRQPVYHTTVARSFAAKR